MHSAINGVTLTPLDGFGVDAVVVGAVDDVLIFGVVIVVVMLNEKIWSLLNIPYLVLYWYMLVVSEMVTSHVSTNVVLSNAANPTYSRDNSWPVLIPKAFECARYDNRLECCTQNDQFLKNAEKLLKKKPTLF